MAKLLKSFFDFLLHDEDGYLGLGLGIAGGAYDALKPYYSNSGVAPALVVDFKNGIYSSDGSSTTNLDSLVTLTASGPSTVFDINGKIKWAPHNTVADPNAMNGAAWSAGSVTTTVDTITEDSTTNYHALSQSSAMIMAANIELTYVIEALPNGHDTVVLQVKGVDNVWRNAAYDMSTGTVTGGGNYSSASIVSLPDGWSRITMVADIGADVGGGAHLSVILNQNASYAGDGVSGIKCRKVRCYHSDLGGMQLNDQGTLFNDGGTSAYYAPGINHDPVTLAPIGAPTRRAKNQLAQYSECKDGTGWSDTGATSTNQALDIIGAFDGVSVASGGLDWHGLQWSNNPTVASGSVYPITLWCRAGTSGQARILLRDTVGVTDTVIKGSLGSLSSAASGSGTISNLTETVLADGLTYQIEFEYTPNHSNPLLFVWGPYSTTSGETFIAGGIYFGGAGEGLGGLYIPTAGAAGTSPDVKVSVPTSVWSWVATEGAMRVEYTARDKGAVRQAIAALNDGTTSEEIAFYISNDATGLVKMLVTDTTTQADFGTIAHTDNVVQRAAGGWQVNDFEFAVGGNDPDTDTLGTLPSPTQLVIGASGNFADIIDGDIGLVVIWSDRLSA